MLPKILERRANKSPCFAYCSFLGKCFNDLTFHRSQCSCELAYFDTYAAAMDLLTYLSLPEVIWINLWLRHFFNFFSFCNRIFLCLFWIVLNIITVNLSLSWWVLYKTWNGSIATRWISFKFKAFDLRLFYQNIFFFIIKFKL